MSHGETTRSWLVSGQTSACPSVVNNFAALAHGNLLTSRNHDDETRGRETTWSRAPPLTSLYQSHRSPSVCVRTAQPTPYPLRGINSIAASQHVRERPLPPRLSIPNDPPMVPRRPPRRGNCRETLDDIAKRVPLQVMCPYFNYPLSVAAKAMHISSATLKRLCRRHGVKRWPHRQLVGVNRALVNIEGNHQVAADGSIDSSVAAQIRELHRRREDIIETAFESDYKKPTAKPTSDGNRSSGASSPARPWSSSTLVPLGNPPLAALLGVV